MMKGKSDAGGCICEGDRKALRVQTIDAKNASVLCGKVHDYLNRIDALEFLKSWQGELVKLDIKKQIDPIEELNSDEAYHVDKMGDVSASYSSWSDLDESLSLGMELKTWDDAGIPCRGDFGSSIRVAGRRYEAFIWWEEEKVAVFVEEDSERDTACREVGIKTVLVSEPAEDILRAMKEAEV